MRYGYTPDGKMRYEAAKKMAGFDPKIPDPNPPKKPKVKRTLKEKTYKKQE